MCSSSHSLLAPTLPTPAAPASACPFPIFSPSKVPVLAGSSSATKHKLADFFPTTTPTSSRQHRQHRQHRQPHTTSRPSPVLLLLLLLLLPRPHTPLRHALAAHAPSLAPPFALLVPLHAAHSTKESVSYTTRQTRTDQTRPDQTAAGYYRLLPSNLAHATESQRQHPSTQPRALVVSVPTHACSLFVLAGLDLDPNACITPSIHTSPPGDARRSLLAFLGPPETRLAVTSSISEQYLPPQHLHS